MGRVKNQHYVPRFVLRRFCFAGEQLFVFAKKTRKSFITSIENVAVEHGFYDQAVEGALGKFEHLAAGALDSLLKQVDQEGCFDANDPNVRAALALFIALQDCRTRVDADEHRHLGLKDFIQQADVDGGQRLLGIDGVGTGDGVLDDVVDGAEGNVPAEAVVEMVDDAAIGAAAIEQQGEDVLPQQLLGDGKMEENFVVVLLCGESLREGLLGGVDLLINELAADVGLLGQPGDGQSPTEGLQGQGLPFLGPHGLGGTSIGDANIGGVGFARKRNSLNHVCFLHETAGMCSKTPANMGETDILVKTKSQRFCYPELNQVQN